MKIDDKYLVTESFVDESEQIVQPDYKIPDWKRPAIESQSSSEEIEVSKKPKSIKKAKRSEYIIQEISLPDADFFMGFKQP